MNKYKLVKHHSDNAYDPDVSASELLIDKVDIRDVTCLIFLDNGAGMDRDKLLKMLSFGFCEKDIYESNASHQPIGHYGNGFKSGSMRIGTDALVFTRSEHSASIGFLSQTYLKATKAESSQESRNNLNAILTFSVFKFEEELKAELRALEGSKTGTKIIISNLKRLENGNLELDFSSDPTDVRCPEAHEADMTSVYHRPVEQYTSEYKLSLREYCSILFLKPRMKITIRGQRVKSKLISKSLAQSERDLYSPSWLGRPVKIIFGFTCDREKSEDYGLMLYHRNRLIKAFERVGYQKQPNDRGIGVVGVAQVDFLQPIHNKQDFKWDEKFNSVMKAFATKLNEYWNEKMNGGNPSGSQAKGNLPDWTWAQCDQCLKWRRLPDTIDPESLPDKWYCRYNRDGTHNRCDIPEEPEDEDLAVKPRFEKTFKKRQEEQKRQQRIRQMEEEQKKKLEMENQLKRKEDELRALQRMKQPMVDHRARDLELALAEAQRCIEEQAHLMEQMASGAFPSPSPVKNRQPNGSKYPPPAHSTQVPFTPNQQTKRKATVESLPTKENKKLCIKTETGEVLSITRNFGDDEESPEQDLPRRKNIPAKPKHAPKGTPLKVAMAFPSTKANHGEEMLKEMNGVKGKHDSSTPVKSNKHVSKSKNISNTLIDLTDDHENFSFPLIKPDPDAIETNTTQEARTELPDVKPDKESLDVQVRETIEKSGKNAKQSSTQELSSSLQSTQESASIEPDNVSQTIESNLETALAAISERADQENLGTVAPSAEHHQEPVASLKASTRATSDTDPSKELGKDPPSSKSGPLAGSDEMIGQPTQAAGNLSHEKNRCVQNEDKEMPAVEELVVDSSLQTDMGKGSENESSHILGVSCESSNQAEKQAHVLTITVNESEPLCNPDVAVETVGYSKTGIENSHSQQSTKEPSQMSSSTTADKTREQDGHQEGTEIRPAKSLMQRGHVQTSQLSKLSESEAENASNSSVGSTLPPSCVDSDANLPSNTSDLYKNTGDSAAQPEKHISHSSKSVSNNVVNNPPATPSSTSPSPHQAVVQEECDDVAPCGSLPQTISHPPESGDHADEGSTKTGIKTTLHPPESGDHTKEGSTKAGTLKDQTASLAQPQRSRVCKATTCSVHVQTEIGSNENSESSQVLLDKMRKNVYRLLELLAPGKDLGDVNDIDKLVEDMIRQGEEGSQSQSVLSPGDSQQ
ncbi:MORC family CW-type zinc finger protein 3 [Elysia marginata]|uniref:MORC family CW-type zinc finger protein 3 n=1 Tax=Elysia marginata TaxID=1093978 RepID=A0AAV4JJ21_9GAST|nr:MORC family CW-type zinc finger protein 3 [Elysia marginata]